MTKSKFRVSLISSAVKIATSTVPRNYSTGRLPGNLLRHFEATAVMGVSEFRATASGKATTLKNAFRSREGFKNFIQVHDTALDKHGHPDSRVTWSNEDLDPTPPAKRTWRWWNYVTFYLGLSFGNWSKHSLRVGLSYSVLQSERWSPTPQTLRLCLYLAMLTPRSCTALGSTMVGIGLNWWQSILVIFASQFISSVAMFFNSRCASVYHIGYPVVARSVFGMWGSYYFVGARAALAIIWYGVQRKSTSSYFESSH